MYHLLLQSGMFILGLLFLASGHTNPKVSKYKNSYGVNMLRVKW